MSSLNEILSRPETRPQVISETERVIEEEVSSKGLAGLPIKAAYKIVKTIKPGFVPEVVGGLLGDFADALDPFYQEALSKNEPVQGYITARADAVAEALLAITDAKSQRAQNPTVKSAYQKLRPTGKKHTVLAVPRVARMIAKFTANA